MGGFRSDLARYRNDAESARLTTFGLIARRFGLQALAVYRLGRWAKAPRGLAGGLLGWLVLWAVHRPLERLVRLVYGIRLNVDADIGPGFYIGHLGSIEIGRCTIGPCGSVAQHTRVGPGAPGEPGPIIGERVWIGAHATVIGQFTVGRGATIAAGARVFEDVPPGALVMGNPARVVRWAYDNSAILGGAPPAAGDG